jgi:putative membrane protein insertion efficiency factor
MTRPQRRAMAWIEAYQRAFAGRPSPCRFYPTCSNYAHEAFEVHGTTRGAWLTLTRLLRCRPFGPSGFDPVPEPHLPDDGHHAAHPVREDD